VSDAPFLIQIGSRDIEGLRGETRNLGKCLEWRDHDET